MSNSFVPKIDMSKGSAKKNSFDLSSNTHTTGEVGYLQPTFSQYLLPNSDLKIKADDTILMSSLICPTFGDLSLRHWFMATPVSSLWACLGAYLSQRSFNDLDSPSGHSIPERMPKFRMGALLRYLSFAPLYQMIKGMQVGDQPLVNNVPCPVQILGNLSYAIKPDSTGKKRTNELYSFDEFEDLLLKRGNDDTYLDSPVSALSYYSRLTYFTIEDIGSNLYALSTGLEEDMDDDSVRYSSMFPWWWSGIVVKNTEHLCYIMGNEEASDTNSDYFPSPDKAPYVVLFFQDVTKNMYKDYRPEILPFTGSKIGGMYAIPLTSRMFAGDTDPVLYRDGWRNDVETRDAVEDENPYIFNPRSSSWGWSLQSDDSYFVGDLFEDPFDVGAVQMYRSQASLDLRNGGFFVCHRLSRRFKRIRKIFIGLGSQFNPFDSSYQLPWKIMSYYKSWFDNFYPKRDIQYYQTPLARFVNYISYHGKVRTNGFLSVFIDIGDYVNDIEQPFFDFIDMLYALGDAKYLMPLDYFSLADKNPLDQNSAGNNQYTDDEWMPVLAGINSTQDNGTGSADTFGTIKGPVYENVGTASHQYETLNGWAIKMADKMLSYLTKKRVVGKSVSDTMRAIFGAVDEHDKAHESTWCFGTHSTPIKIRAITSTTENEEIHLGDYAGQGLGGSSSRMFKIENNADLLCVVVMSAIVPRMSYFQGVLHENFLGDSPNDFCKPIWDAVGYDDVFVEEYIADATDKNDLRNTDTVPSARGMADFNGKSLGLVPKYTWAKVSRDILNGDMSLPSLRASMNPYVLTRNVPVSFGTDPLEMRTINPDDFNKIFNESSSLDDHFIIQIGFKAEAFKPLKSISTSFEDFDEDEDGVISVEHS